MSCYKLTGSFTFPFVAAALAFLWAAVQMWRLHGTPSGSRSTARDTATHRGVGRLTDPGSMHSIEGAAHDRAGKPANMGRKNLASRMSPIAEALAGEHPADVADAIEALSPEAGADVLEAMPPEAAADALEQMDEADAEEIIEDMEPAAAATALGLMALDDAADILAEMPPMRIVRKSCARSARSAPRRA